MCFPSSRLFRFRFSLLGFLSSHLIFGMLTLVSQGITAAPKQATHQTATAITEPEMVRIKSGSFRMGCIFGDCSVYSRPVHTVSIDAFMISKYEITFEQWDQCFSAGGCDHYPNDHGWGRGQNPVINVSWNDAQQYVDWLSRVTGKVYLLPSEAQWEYAARAGSSSKYPWGNELGSNWANCNDCLKQKLRRSLPVGSFPANEFGLYDMLGNVFEMTQDCWGEDYRHTPRNGQASMLGRCYRRVTRGGAWSSDATSLLTANRFSITHFHRYNVIGFRVARPSFPNDQVAYAMRHLP